MFNSSVSTTLTTDVFVSWQVWLWPMWTPACLPIRPPLLSSVSESTCWTWFPPVLSPKQPTHGNNAIFFPTDIITITPLNINNSHSHYHSNPFYGLCLWLKWCRGEPASSSDISATIFLTWILHPKLELCCDSLGFWDTRNMSNRIWVPFLRVGVYMGVYNFTNFSSDVASPSLYNDWASRLHQEEKFPSSTASGLGRGGKKSLLYTVKYSPYVLPFSSLSQSDSGPCGGRTELNWRPHHRDCGWASRTIHETITASALQKWIT